MGCVSQSSAVRRIRHLLWLRKQSGDYTEHQYELQSDVQSDLFLFPVDLLHMGLLYYVIVIAVIIGAVFPPHTNFRLPFLIKAFVAVTSFIIILYPLWQLEDLKVSCCGFGHWVRVLRQAVYKGSIEVLVSFTLLLIVCTIALVNCLPMVGCTCYHQLVTAFQYWSRLCQRGAVNEIAQQVVMEQLKCQVNSLTSELGASLDEASRLKGDMEAIRTKLEQACKTNSELMSQRDKDQSKQRKIFTELVTANLRLEDEYDYVMRELDEAKRALKLIRHQLDGAAGS